jgi:hypothetical protein
MKAYRHNHLKDMIITLARQKVEFIICGGVALVLHGVERMTIDLDLVVDLRESNLRSFLKAMKILQLQPRVPVPTEILLDPEKRQILVDEKNALVFTFIDLKNPYRQIDIFITDKISFDHLKDHVDIINLDGFKVKLLTKEKLLEMKKTIDPARDKDIFDIKALEKMLRENKE